MRGITPHTEQGDPSRILRFSAIRARMRSRQLISYRALQVAMQDAHELARFANLQQIFFPEEEAPSGDLLDVTAYFFHLVDDALFPLDLNYMDSMYQSSGDVHDVISWEIPHVGWGVAHEVVGMDDLPTWSWPVVSLIGGTSDWFKFWDEANIPYPEEGITWAHDPQIAILRLQDLEPPLDALAVACRCVQKDTGNPFFDAPDLWWRGEYWGLFDQFLWAESDIRALASYYRQAKPDLERLRAYRAWVDEDYEYAFTVIARTFIEMEEALND